MSESQLKPNPFQTAPITGPRVYHATLESQSHFESPDVIWEAYGLDPKALYDLLTVEALKVAPDEAWEGDNHWAQMAYLPMETYSATLTARKLEC